MLKNTMIILLTVLGISSAFAKMEEPKTGYEFINWIHKSKDVWLDTGWDYARVYTQIKYEIRNTQFKNCEVVVEEPETDLVNGRQAMRIDLIDILIRKKLVPGNGLEFRRNSNNSTDYKIYSTAAGPYQTLLFVRVDAHKKISYVSRVECPLDNDGNDENSCRLAMRCDAQ